MGRYNDEEIALKHTPLNGKKLRFAREVHMDLINLGDYSTTMLDEIYQDINNLERYDFNIWYNEKGEYFKNYPSYADLYEDEKHFHYREGIIALDTGLFTMTIFIDIFNLEDRHNLCDVLDIIHY